MLVIFPNRFLRAALCEQRHYVNNFFTPRSEAEGEGLRGCTFKWSDGRTVETIGAPPIIQHRSSLGGNHLLNSFLEEASPPCGKGAKQIFSPHQHESTSEPQRPVLALPKHRKIQKQPKTYPPQPKNQQQKWL
jgi:hypothetical protein